MTLEIKKAESSLLSLGFSEKEASVYLYLLEKGVEVGGSKIALGTNLHRQYVYNALQKLISQGLVEEVAHGKLSKYRAFPPKELEKIAKRRLLETEDTVKLLERFSKAGHQQESEVLFGLRDLVEHEYQFEDNAEIREKQYIIGGNADAFIDIMEDHYHRIKQLDEKKKVVTYYIGSKKDKADEKLHIGRENRFHMRYLEKMPEGITHMVIRKDRVCFFSFLNPPTIHIIKSKIVVENYEKFFRMLWEMAGEGK
jgi:sugar-specific transcriptional regulator TrmB